MLAFFILGVIYLRSLFLSPKPNKPKPNKAIPVAAGTGTSLSERPITILSNSPATASEVNLNFVNTSEASNLISTTQLT